MVGGWVGAFADTLCHSPKMSIEGLLCHGSPEDRAHTKDCSITFVQRLLTSSVRHGFLACLTGLRVVVARGHTAASSLAERRTFGSVALRQVDERCLYRRLRVAFVELGEWHHGSPGPWLQGGSGFHPPTSSGMRRLGAVWHL